MECIDCLMWSKHVIKWYEEMFPTLKDDLEWILYNRRYRMENVNEDNND